jgi:protein tyrosine/serine phosphatase
MSADDGQPIREAATAAAVELEGVANFRDFGGHVGADGRRVRRGRLYRSGHHTAATDADLARLAALNLAVIVDLRRPGERARAPSRRPRDCRAAILEHGGPRDQTSAPHLAALSSPDITKAAITERMTVGYRGYPVDPYYVAMYRAYFARLAGVEGPVLVHCHAGKDRTGVLCALTLHVLGVSRADIFEDYLATNRHTRFEDRIGELTVHFQRVYGRQMPEDLLRHLMMADRAYLDAFFAEIDALYGDMDAYLERELGVTPAVRERIRNRLLEG